MTVKHLYELDKQARALGVHNICESILYDYRFFVWSAASKPNLHHYGKGGLVIHTKEVVDLCFINAGYYRDQHSFDDKALFLAAFFHDVGKMWDYEPLDEDYMEWRGTEHKTKIHHISRSVMVWTKAVSNYSEYSYLEDEVSHAILSHHGLREWGSPVSPATRLAWVLHLSDCMSARMYDCDSRTK